MRDFNKIKAYQHADKLVLKVYEISNNFPKEEVYALTSQIRRAAISVPTNIVEGAGRQSLKDYLHFLYIARGSLLEVGYLLTLSQKLGYISESSFLEIELLKEETSKTLYGLISSVSSEINIKLKIKKSAV